MIKNIVFDMGNVLLDFDPQVSLDRFCGSEEEKEIIRKNLFEGPEWLMADRGVIRDCERYDLVKVRVAEEHWPALKNCAEYWSDCMHRPLPGAYDFVRDCKAAGYRVYILSNASDLFFTYFNNFSPLDWFDGAVVSCQELLLKPEPEIYRRLFRRYGLKPEESFFIDDREANVRGGEALGMPGHVFQNDYPELRRILGLHSS